MKSESQVKELITTLKNQGVPLSDVAWQAAKACTGYPYVYGATGELCRPAKRAQYGTKFYPKDHKTIVTKCKAISWDAGSKTCKVTGNCSGCQWDLPVMMFDCRGFTRKILQMVYNWTLMGGTVGSQWNDASNWKDKGEIGSMPQNTLVCLFVFNKAKNNWQHTGFGYNDETMEASSGVEYHAKRAGKWTHWAVPKCVDYTPQPVPEGYAVVTGIRVAVRKDPCAKADIITRLETGTQVKVEIPPESAWDYVSFGDKSGWMMKQYLQEDCGKAIVTGRRVAIRQDPSLKANIITRVDTGKTVWLEPEPPSEWDYITYKSYKGFMMKQYLKEG